MQDEIVELEERLALLDEEASNIRNDWRLNNGSFRNDPLRERRQLVSEILPRKLAAYSKLDQACGSPKRPLIHKTTSSTATASWFSDRLFIRTTSKTSASG
jgi:hypothetical protein